MTITGTNENDALYAEVDGDVVNALDGNDFIFNNAEGTTLVGGAGNDHYRLFNAKTTIVEDADGGHDIIWAYDHVVMPDNVEDLVFKRTSDWHAIRGNALDNLIIAGEGEQAISGGGGNDTITGGEGIDTFYFETGGGHDIITDYTPGTDNLTFWDVGIETLDTLRSYGADTDDGYLITLSEDQSILLTGVTGAELSSSDLPLQQLPLDFLDGATVTFEDTFDSAASLESGLWNTTPSNGHPVTAAAARGSRFHTYVDAESTTEDGETIGVDPFSFQDGVLSITASRTPEPLVDELEPWLSGILETHGTFEQTYGYFEMRAKTPDGQGFWPAFWLMPADFSWPPESDVLEILGSQSDIYRAATHAEFWGDKVTVADSWLVPDTAEEFHTYGLLWTPETLTYTFDGRVMLETPTPAGMHVPHALRLNLAIGGWDGDPDETTPDNASFDVDYVRAYEIPGLSDLPQNTDMSAFVDAEAGILNTSEFSQLDLYGDDVRRLASGDPTAQLAPLEEGTTATLVGNAFDNVLTGNALGTVLNGKAGDDFLNGAGGDDYLIGEDGSDTLEGGTGNDTLVGGLGDDTYVIRRADGSETRSFELILEQPGQGYDTLHLPDMVPGDIRSFVDWARWHIVFDGESGPVYVSVKVTPAIGGTDLGSYIERLVFADGTVWDLTGGLYLHGDDDANTSSGTQHSDTILGAGGDDTLIGMDGDDVLDGGSGLDDLYGWNGNDTLTDSGDEAGDRLMGEAGDDHLTGGRGWDFLFGGDGDDRLFASSDGDALDGGAGDDFVKGKGSDDSLTGGTGQDTLIGAAGSDVIWAGAGDDVAKGNSGDDTLHGGDGRDRLLGGGERDDLSGGQGRDTLHGGQGDDTLDGGGGRDVLIGGAGSDLFVFKFSEVDRDFIRDFGDEDLIQIHVEDNPLSYELTISDRWFTLRHIDTDTEVEIRVSNVDFTDIEIL